MQTLSDKLKSMKARDWLLVIAPLIATWAIDQLSKAWAAGLYGTVHKGPVTFILQHNHGAMLGLFTELPSVLRIVTLSTSGAFLLCAYGMIQYMLPSRSLLLRGGLSALVGGILGNVTDRILYGYVIDFIMFGYGRWPTPVFNLGDVFQWCGYAAIAVAVIREGHRLWPENELRSHYWVNKKFQIKYSLLLASIGLGLSMIGLVFSYTYLRVTIAELVGNNEFLIRKFLTPFIVSYALICLAFCGLLFVLGKYITHRIAGPVYAFERFVRSRLQGNETPDLRLRAGDDFLHLEELSREISSHLKDDAKAKSDPQEEQQPPASSKNKIS